MDIFHEKHKSNLANCFVPELLINFIKKNVRSGKNKIEPTSLFVNGVCLIVDISGFTRMSEKFCDGGKAGIDGLQLTTNGYMGKLVDVIYQFGGDIIKFAGDALVCVFISSDFTEDKAVSVSVILRAMHCASIVREVRTENLTVHVAMSCGEMCFGIMGGFENRWECLISGTCIHQLSDCLDDASSMEAVLSPECAEILKQSSKLANAAGEAVVEGPVSITTVDGTYKYQLNSLLSGNYKLMDITHQNNTAASMFGLVPNSAKAFLTKKASTLSSHHVNHTDDLIRLFVPPPIGEELDNATGLNYFAEIREVVTMFMKWDSYDANGKHRDLLELQPCFFQAQRILASTGAYLRQFLVDDKGCVLIACWGMPNMSYVDNSYRAISSASMIQLELSKLGMNTSVGITSGDVYCGTVGSALRMEYAAIGSCVNMSARLMGKANGRILIDESAYMRLSKTARDLLEAIEPMMVKGKALPLQAYKYIAASQSTNVAKYLNAGGDELPDDCRCVLKALLARHTGTPSSMAALSSSQSQPLNRPDGPSSRPGSHPSSPCFVRSAGFWSKLTPFKTPRFGDTLPVVLISGKEGSGRTSAVTWLRAQAAERNITSVGLRLSRKDGMVEFSLWKRLFPLLMPKNLFLDNDSQRMHVFKLIRKVFPGATQLVEQRVFPALRSSLGVTCTFAETFPQPAPPKNLKKGLWAASEEADFSHVSVHYVLLKIFVYLLSTQPTLCVLEHIEMADEESLALLVEVIKLRSSSSLVLTTLVFHQKGPAKKRVGSFLMPKKYQLDAANCSSWSRTYRDVVMRHKSTTPIMLENYTPEQINKMLSGAMGGAAVPADITDLVQKFSGGSCFWVREIIQCIKENGSEQFMSALGEGEEPKGDSGKSMFSFGSAGLNDEISVRSKPQPSLAQRRRTSQVQTTTKASLSRAASFNDQDTNHSQLKLDKLVLCRLNNLPTEMQRLLRSASIIGTSFSSKVLHAVLPNHLKDTMSASLETLLHQKWLYQDADCDHKYQFTHSHTHRVLYQLTPPSERNILHQRIADHIVDKYPDDRSQYASICYHYQHGDIDKALQYAVKATTVMLETDDIFDFGDCLDLLFGTFQCCTSTYDVDVLLKLVEEVATGIQNCNIRTSAYSSKFAYIAAYFQQFVTGAKRASGLAVSFSISSKRNNSSKKVVPVAGLYRPSESERRYDTETEDGDSDLDLSPMDLERRTKTSFLSQLERLTQQLNTLKEKLNAVKGKQKEASSKSSMPEGWQRDYLNQ